MKLKIKNKNNILISEKKFLSNKISHKNFNLFLQKMKIKIK